MTGVLRDLQRRAMLGAERSAEPLSAPGELGDVVRGLQARLDDGSPEGRAHALLGQIAAATHHHRVAAMPLSAFVCSASCAQPDNRPAMSRRGQRQLAAMLRDGPYACLLPEWLGVAANANLRPPARLLPALLEAGRRLPERQEALVAVIGPRGRWLAGHSPRWSYAHQTSKDSPVPTRELLEEGVFRERLAALRTWRAVEPNAARAWVGAALDTERARERTGLLAVLEVGLGPDDEHRLEQRLGDRAKDVRSKAAGLLARLPGSRFIQRMEDRAARCLTWLVDPEGLTELEVQPPRRVDEEAGRDGVTDRPVVRMGKRAWWLSQFLSVVPPSRWTVRWQVTPRELLQAAARGDWADLLIHAWAEACDRHPDAAWAEALLTERLYHGPNLWHHVPLARAEPLLGRALRREASGGHLDRALSEVPRLRGPWSEKFSRAVATSIRTAIEKGQPLARSRFRELMDACARRMAPETHEAIRDIVIRSLEPSPWSPLLEQTVELIGFRAAMLRELEAGTKRRGA